METLLKAQLQALEDLRRTTGDAQPLPRRGPSHTDMAEDILRDAQRPLHARDIIDRIKTKYGVSVGRESLVSALLKHTARGRFLKTAANTFSLPPTESRP